MFRGDQCVHPVLSSKSFTRINTILDESYVYFATSKWPYYFVRLWPQLSYRKHCATRLICLIAVHVWGCLNGASWWQGLHCNIGCTLNWATKRESLSIMKVSCSSFRRITSLENSLSTFSAELADVDGKRWTSFARLQTNVVVQSYSNVVAD